jgi:hypothetical protein
MLALQQVNSKVRNELWNEVVGAAETSSCAAAAAGSGSPQAVKPPRLLAAALTYGCRLTLLVRLRKPGGAIQPLLLLLAAFAPAASAAAAFLVSLKQAQDR